MRFYFLFNLLLSYTPFSQINWYQIGTSTNKQIFELFTDSDEVNVAGNFTQIGGIQSGEVTRCNGSAWKNLSSSNLRTNAVNVNKVPIYFSGKFSSVSTSESASKIVQLLALIRIFLKRMFPMILF
jgi:hypothetical protein